MSFQISRPNISKAVLRIASWLSYYLNDALNFNALIYKWIKLDHFYRLSKYNLFLHNQNFIPITSPHRNTWNGYEIQASSTLVKSKTDLVHLFHHI